MFYVKWSVWKRINNDLRHVIDFWLEFKRVTCKSDDLIKRNALWFFRSHTFSYICHSEMFVFRILCHLHTCVLNWVTERFWCEEVKLFLLGKFETLSVCLSFSLSPLPPSIRPSSPLLPSLHPSLLPLLPSLALSLIRLCLVFSSLGTRFLRYTPLVLSNAWGENYTLSHGGNYFEKTGKEN